MPRTAGLILTSLILAGPATAQGRDQCEYEAQRDSQVQASASETLMVIARAGFLRVEGRAGITEVRVRGTACASSQGLLDQLVVEVTRGGAGVRVEVPELDRQGWDWGNDRYARLDLTIEVPAGMAADIEDGSGEIFVSGTGDLRVDDGSGSIDVQDVTGNVDIDDGSGEIAVTRAGGDVTIDDGSGEIELRDVTGDVTVDDGSGEIEIAGVGGSVRIPGDGTGSIDVEDVEGDLVVRDADADDIRYSNVRGAVDVPEERRGRGRRRG